MKVNQKRRLLVAGAAALSVSAVAAYAVGEPNIRSIKVVARKFYFTPSTIHINQGETVELELTTEDVVMGLNVPGLKVRSDIIPGMVKRLQITPEKAGRFDFYCDIFCGSGHEDMAGVVVVA